MSTLRNLTTGEPLARRVEPAKTFWQRTVGLLPRETIDADEGLWIDHCSSIHTVGMRAPIDVIFVDKQGHVLRIVRGVGPGNPSVSHPLAHGVVELGVSAALGHDLLVGDRIALE